MLRTAVYDRIGKYSTAGLLSMNDVEVHPYIRTLDATITTGLSWQIIIDHTQWLLGGIDELRPGLKDNRLPGAVLLKRY